MTSFAFLKDFRAPARFIAEPLEPCRRGQEDFDRKECLKVMKNKSDFLARLNSRRAELIRELMEIEDRLDDQPDKDWSDRVTERQGDEVLEALGNHDVSELRQIDAALARFRSGTYGVCVRCGEMIAHRRLDALPATPVCSKCARLKDGNTADRS